MCSFYGINIYVHSIEYIAVEYTYMQNKHTKEMYSSGGGGGDTVMWSYTA